jgi:hypothetical protein
MKHLRLELQKLEERIAPCGCSGGAGTGGSQKRLPAREWRQSRQTILRRSWLWPARTIMRPYSSRNMKASGWPRLWWCISGRVQPIFREARAPLIVR